MRKRGITRPSNSKTRAVPSLALTQGQTLWLLSELGFREGVSASTFNHYVKSLRKLRRAVRDWQGPVRRPSRCHLPVRRVDGAFCGPVTAGLLDLADTIVAGLRDFREDLRSIYRRAYFDLTVHQHPPVRISAPGGLRTTMNGLYLDLNIRYSAGKMIEFGPPKAISSFEAVSIYAHAEAPARSYLPLNVSAVAEMIVTRTRALPIIRRGRAPRLPATS